MRKIGVISNLFGVFGPPELITFLMGVDELCIVGNVINQETLDLWRSKFEKVHVVRGSEDDENQEFFKTLDKHIILKVEGMNIFLSYFVHKNEKPYEGIINLLLKYKVDVVFHGRNFSYDVSKNPQWYREYLNERFQMETMPEKIKIEIQKALSRNIWFISPGSVSPLASSNDCSAVRFEVENGCIKNFQRFRMDCPDAYSFNNDGTVSKTKIFIDNCVVNGKYEFYTNSQLNPIKKK